VLPADFAAGGPRLFNLAHEWRALERRYRGLGASDTLEWASQLREEELSELELRLLVYSEHARSRNVRFLTLRRVSELLGLSPRPFAQLNRHLLERHPQRLEPPVWRCDG
jgi:hypothetical protein